MYLEKLVFSWKIVVVGKKTNLTQSAHSNRSSSFEPCNSDAIGSLGKYRKLNLHQLIIAHINISSLKSKSDLLLWADLRIC